VTYGRHTGQEKTEEWQRMAANPPDIILTNSMMLEHSLLDVFILHFCDQLHNELMQGMIKRYVEKTQNLNVIRSRLKTE